MTTDTQLLINEAKGSKSGLFVEVNGRRQLYPISVFAAPLLRELCAADYRGVPLYSDRVFWRDQREDLRKWHGIQTEVRDEKAGMLGNETPHLKLIDDVKIVDAGL